MQVNEQITKLSVFDVLTIQVPRGPSLHHRSYLDRSAITLHLRRHYPSLIATTTSCASPKSSYHFLLASYMIGLYWLVPSQFEVGPSRRYL